MQQDEINFHYQSDMISFAHTLRVRWKQRDWASDFDTLVRIKILDTQNTVTVAVILLRPKKILVSGNPTDSNYFGSTLKHFGTSETFSSIFRVFFNDFYAFPI